MLFLRRSGFLLPILLFFLAFQAFSYDNERIHPGLTEAAAQVYNANFDNVLTEEQNNWLVQGSIKEDTFPRYFNHFYDPTTGLGLNDGKYSGLSAKLWAQDQSGLAAVSGDYSESAILANYKVGNYERAYEGIGHILHLVQDMSVPAHTKNDAHPKGDPFEEWAQEFGKIEAENLKLIQINSLDQVFDELASFSNNDFFSEDRIDQNIFAQLDFQKEDNLDGGNNYYGYYKGYRIVKVSKRIGYEEYDFDYKVNRDYWNMLYPKAVGYSAGVIDYFLQEFKKIDQAQNEEDSSLWDKIKNKISNVDDYLKYKFGDNIIGANQLGTKTFKIITGTYEDAQEFVGFYKESNQEIIQGAWGAVENMSGQVLGDKQESEEETEEKEVISEKPGQVVQVKEVIDGDTIILTTGERVRYIGVDTPELGKAGSADDECLAWVARLRNLNYLNRGEVRLAKDEAVDKDKYGRLLRYVYVNDVFLNKELAREGLGEVFFCQAGWENCPVTSDQVKQSEITQAGEEAKEYKRGLYSGVCDVSKSEPETEQRLDSKEDLDEKSEEYDEEKTNNTSSVIIHGGNSTEEQDNNTGSGQASVGQADESETNTETELDTSIILFPAIISSSSVANFAFKASDNEASFECALDNLDLASCEVESSFSDLIEGEHLIEVRAKKDEKIDETPAQFVWLIDTLAPTSSINILEDSYQADFSVNWAGEDQNGSLGSGLAYFDVQYRIDNSDWAELVSKKTGTSTIFSINDINKNSTVCFRSRATDYIGNQEDWSEEICTQVEIIKIPKVLTFNLNSLTSSSTIYTASTTVGINLDIENSDLVTGYYLSEELVEPELADSNWTLEKPNNFIISSEETEKIVYLWLKQEDGIFSEYASSSIILDMTAPASPVITNIESDLDGIYWINKKDVILAGEKEQSVEQILVNNNKFIATSSEEIWSLYYNFYFSDCLELEMNEMASCLLEQGYSFSNYDEMQDLATNLQIKELSLQAVDEAGNKSVENNIVFKQDTSGDFQYYIVPFKSEVSKNVYLYMKLRENTPSNPFLLNSGKKGWDIEYQKAGDDWQSVGYEEVKIGNTWFNKVSLEEAGQYSLQARGIDWAGNTGEWDTETELSFSVDFRPVISEFYGGGGNSGAYYKDDFIELYNPTENDISLAGWSVQYASAESSDWQVTEISGSISAYGFYLIKQSQGSGGEQALTDFDIEGDINLAASKGKIALVNNTEPISGVDDEHVVDFVGYGKCNESEVHAARSPSNTTSAERRAFRSSYPADMQAGGAHETLGNAWDENRNDYDFLIRESPDPQSSKSSIEVAGF